jgi:hypothetical protein
LFQVTQRQQNFTFRLVHAQSIAPGEEQSRPGVWRNSQNISSAKNNISNPRLSPLAPQRGEGQGEGCSPFADGMPAGIIDRATPLFQSNKQFE